MARYLILRTFSGTDGGGASSTNRNQPAFAGAMARIRFTEDDVPREASTRGQLPQSATTFADTASSLLPTSDALRTPTIVDESQGQNTGNNSISVAAVV